MLKFRPTGQNSSVIIPELPLKSCSSIHTAHTTRESQHSQPMNILNTSLSYTRRDESGHQVNSQRKINEIIPGIKFGRFFGSIQEATQRQVKRRISERTGAVPTELDVVTETVRGLSRGRDLSVSEKLLLGKIEHVENQIKRFNQVNPKIKKENDQLREHNRSLRVESETMKKRAERWEKENKIKEEELRESMENHYLFQTRMVKIHNQTLGNRGIQIRVSRLQ